MGVVRGHFRPEFLNRVDEIILFHRLRRDGHGRDRRHPARAAAEAAGRPQDHARRSTQGARLAGREGLRPGLRGAAAEAGDPEGVQDPLAEKILSGHVHDGETVPVTAGHSGLLIGPEDIEPDASTVVPMPKRMLN